MCCIDPFVASPFGLSLTVQAASEGIDRRHATPHRYDVINVDPIDPPICTLYSQDFFQLCHDRLRDGGLMVQWLPLFRLSPDNIKVVLQGFLNVFEHTTVWYNGTAAILTQQPILSHIGPEVLGRPARFHLRITVSVGERIK